MSESENTEEKKMTYSFFFIVPGIGIFRKMYGWVMNENVENFPN